MKEEFKRLPKETLVDYAIRLGKMEQSREFYGINWKTIQNLMNHETGKNVNGDYWRRKIHAYLEVYENDQQKEIGIKKVEQKRLEELTERRKLQSIRIDINKQGRENDRKDLIAEEVKRAIVQIPAPKFEPLQEKVTDFNKCVSYPFDDDDHEGILSFGDIHFGKKFESLNNKYSCEIAQDRMQSLFDKTVRLVKYNHFQRIKIINLADSIEGMQLRISQLQALQIGFVDQVILFSKMMASWLNSLSKYVEINYIHIPSANHTEIRPFNSKRGEWPAEDMERLIQFYLKTALKNNKRISMKINDRGIVPFKVAGYDAVALHGHQFTKNQRENLIKNLNMMFHKFFSFVYLGHFHSGEYKTLGAYEDTNAEMIQVPSIMGSDTFSDSLGLSAKAGAAFDIFEKGKGRTVQYNITLN